jgi:hypothetical protein
MRKLKIAGAISSIIITAFLLVLLISPNIRSQIMSISGLAVAQSPIQWNNIKDAAAGDHLTNGLPATAIYTWDPITLTWVRVVLPPGGIFPVSLPSTGLLTLLTAPGAPTVGATNDVSATFPSKMTWEIVVLGAPANQSTNLEGSINGTTWYTLDISTTTTSEMRHLGFKPILYVRANCTVLASGTCTIRYAGGGN